MKQMHFRIYEISPLPAIGAVQRDWERVYVKMELLHGGCLATCDKSWLGDLGSGTVTTDCMLSTCIAKFTNQEKYDIILQKFLLFTDNDAIFP